jgi:ribonuclease P/MRP protein subunit POP5
MQKIKSLMPSLKERKRYLAVKIEAVDGALTRNPMEELTTKLRNTLGVFNAAEAGIMPVDYDLKNKVAIIRVSESMLDRIRASLLFISELGTQRVILRSLRVSGMVNKVKEIQSK